MSLRRALGDSALRASPAAQSFYIIMYRWLRAGGARGQGRSWTLGGPGRHGREGHGEGWQRGPPKTNLDNRRLSPTLTTLDQYLKFSRRSVAIDLKFWPILT